MSNRQGSTPITVRIGTSPDIVVVVAHDIVMSDEQTIDMTATTRCVARAVADQLRLMANLIVQTNHRNLDDEHRDLATRRDDDENETTIDL